MQQYESAFRDNAIDAAVLPELTAQDLKDLGVSRVGHRRKLLAAIAVLRSGPVHDRLPAAGVPFSVTERTTDVVTAERRQLTVMFCDLVGSTALAARLDPEDLRDLITAYNRAVTEVVAQFEGFVAKYMGDGILIYFGYPRANEDDAERAARCALAVVDIVSRLKLTEELRTRFGIATGMVVVGDLVGRGEAQERGVVGETPNLAARLQSLAEPNTVLIDENTRRLLGNLFEYRDIGAVEARGFSGTVSVWEVLRPSTVASRFEALRASLTPLIGRGEEIEFLLRRWRRARRGEGQVVLLSGEPGIGKSRIAAALAERLHDDPHYHLRYFCSQYHQNTALHPVIMQLEHAAGFARDEAPAMKLEKLRRLFARGRLGHLRRRVALHANQRSRKSDQEADLLLLALAGVRQALVADLLSLPTASALSEMNLTPQRKKEKTLEALLDRLEDLCRQRPVLMVFEDTQWIDPTSHELLDLTIDRIRALPVLLIIAFRPEFQPAWRGPANIGTLALDRLDTGEAAALAETVAGKALPREVVAQIAARADGIPLFAEELTRAIIESGLLRDEGSRYTLDRPLPRPAIPQSLHASLLARLDRLGSAAKEIAQIGSAIGRDFSCDLLASVAQHSEQELTDALGRLVDSGLILQQGTPPEATFLFKHALVQDTAYGTLLRGPRQALHARIASEFEEHFPSVAEIQPQILAHHFTEAGILERAVAYWCRAGQQSAGKSAFIEAIAQLRRGLQLIANLPQTRECKQQELELLVTLAGALMGMRGYAHPEVAEAFSRARNLVLEMEGAGTTPHFSVLYGLWVADFVGGKPKASLERADEFLSFAQSLKETGLLVKGHQLVGTTLLSIGDYAAAFPHLERAVAFCAPEQHRAHAIRFAADIDVAALCNWAWALWHRGFPDQASNAAHEALQHAEQSVHIPTLAYALVHLGIKAAFERRAAETEQRASEALALAKEHGLAMWSGYGLMLQGWALSQREQGEAAVERIRAGLTATKETAARNFEPLFLGLLAEAFAIAGEIEGGLAILSEAFAMADASGQNGTDAELHRLRGDLLHRLPSPDWTEVEISYRTALSVAREQGTRGFELRAAVSLARLLSAAGRREEAHDLLGPVYGWFTEGFDTPDLQEAKALLEALNA
jgi:class 3 adenylate cyclase/predicted ATPase